MASPIAPASFHQAVAEYPTPAQEALLRLRRLILEVAAGISGLDDVEETRKWGEPAYLAKGGTTLRIDWKAKHADQVALYVSCTSKLVPTWRKMYPELLQFEGNRALILPLGRPFPEEELKNYIQLALTYHRVKRDL